MTKSNTSRRGAAKVAVVLILLGLMGVAVVGAGTLRYLNWDKISFLQKHGEEEQSGELTQGSQAPSGPRPVVASSPKHADERVYASSTKRDDVLVLVDYYADWCPPCRGIAPMLTKLASAHGDKVVVLKVNVDRERKLASRAGVSSIPDVRLLHAGKQLERSVGGRNYSHYESIVLKHEKQLPPPPANSPSVPAKNAGESITPLKEDWLPPGVSRVAK